MKIEVNYLILSGSPSNNSSHLSIPVLIECNRNNIELVENRGYGDYEYIFIDDKEKELFDIKCDEMSHRINDIISMKERLLYELVWRDFVISKGVLERFPPELEILVQEFLIPSYHFIDYPFKVFDYYCDVL